MAINSIGSGLDVNGIVAQLVAADRAPVEQRLNRVEQKTNVQISALGSLTSALNGLQNALKTFDGVGASVGRVISAPDTSGITGVADSTALTGSYTVRVDQLAQADRRQWAPVVRNADGSAAWIGTGLLNIKVGDQDMETIAINPSKGSITDIAQAINAQSRQITAQVIRGDLGDVLTLSATKTGAANVIQVIGQGDLSALSTSNSSWTTTQAAQDAVVRINNTVKTSSTNTLTDVIPGVQWTISKTTDLSGITMEVKNDPSALTTKMNGLIGAYNQAMTQLRSVTFAGSSTSPAGPLSGEGSVRGLQQRLRTTLSTASDALQGMGIKTAIDGTLSLDRTKWEKVLTSNPNTVSELWSDTSPLGKTVRDQINAMVGSNGLLTTKQENLTRQAKETTAQRITLEARMSRAAEAYRRQFAALDSMIVQMQNSSNHISKQLGL